MDKCVPVAYRRFPNEEISVRLHNPIYLEEKVYPQYRKKLLPLVLLMGLLAPAIVSAAETSPAIEPAVPQAVPQAVAPQTSAEVAKVYSGNAKSKVFHKQGCRYFSCKSCTVSFTSSEEATSKGYKPCKVCNK